MQLAYEKGLSRYKEYTETFGKEPIQRISIPIEPIPISSPISPSTPKKSTCSTPSTPHSLNNNDYPSLLSSKSTPKKIGAWGIQLKRS
jgi:hypothetical protein